MVKNQSLYHLLTLAAVIIWGTTFASTKVLLNAGLTPAVIMLYRFILAYGVMWLVRPKFYRPKNWMDEGLFMLAGITGGSLYFLTENTALKLTLSSNVALLLATAPILTVLLTRWLLRGEKIQNNLIWGSLIALAGVMCVIYNGSVVLELHPLGDLLSLIAALMWGFYIVCLKLLDRKYGTWEITRKVFFYGILTLLPYFMIEPLRWNGALMLEPKVWGNLLFLGLIASFLCYVMWNLAVKYLGAMRTSSYIYLVPLVALLFSAWLLDEPITPIALTGAAMILAGVYVAERGFTLPLFKRINQADADSDASSGH